MKTIRVLFLFLALSALWMAECNSNQLPQLAFKYNSNEELNAYMATVSKVYPQLTSLYSIGKSIRGIDILVLRISAASDAEVGIPNVKLVGNIHGNEPVGREVILHFIEFLVTNYSSNTTVQWFLNNTRIHLLPTINPDGFRKSEFIDCNPNGEGRTNLRGLDLNRNFPDPFRNRKIPTQLEVLSIMKWLKTTPFILSASIHGGALVVNYPYDSNPRADAEEDILNTVEAKTPDDDVFRHISMVYSSTHPTMHKGLACPKINRTFPNGIVNGAKWYSVIGGMQDYNYVLHGCLEVTLELSCCKYPHEDDLRRLWEENKEALFKYFSQSHRGVQGLILNCETKKPISGATLHVKGRNIPFNSTANGEFWRILMPGEYTLEIRADGYKYDEYFFRIEEPEDNFLFNMTWLDVHLESSSSNVTCNEKKKFDEISTETPTTPTTVNLLEYAASFNTQYPSTPSLEIDYTEQPHGSSASRHEFVNGIQSSFFLFVVWLCILNLP